MARLLEIMINGATAKQFAEIREFLEERGFRIQESEHGDVFRLWCAPPAEKRVTRSGWPKDEIFKRREEMVRGLDDFASKVWR